MKRLFGKENTQVLRGEFWTSTYDKSMIAKCRAMAPESHTFNWMLLFLKTNDVLSPACLSSGIRNKSTGEINEDLFDYIPWYLGYRDGELGMIISAPYEPMGLTEQLDMIANQLTLEAEKYKDKIYKNKPQTCSEWLDGKDTIEQLLGDSIKVVSNREPSEFLEYGMPQDLIPLREQLAGPCLGIHNVVREELKGWGYNEVCKDRVLYCGEDDVALPMLTTLFVMAIIKNYFKSGRTYDPLKIDSTNNIKMVRKEMRKVLSFEKKIINFWTSFENYSGFNDWEKENFNTIKHNTDTQRSIVNLYPSTNELLDETRTHNDLGHFPETALF